jgi:hypothetical protein
VLLCHTSRLATLRAVGRVERSEAHHFGVACREVIGIAPLRSTHPAFLAPPQMGFAALNPSYELTLSDPALLRGPRQIDETEPIFQAYVREVSVSPEPRYLRVYL